MITLANNRIFVGISISCSSTSAQQSFERWPTNEAILDCDNLYSNSFLGRRNHKFIILAIRYTCGNGKVTPQDVCEFSMFDFGLH
jgi:hypothetical protein